MMEEPELTVHRGLQDFMKPSDGGFIDFQHKRAVPLEFAQYSELPVCDLPGCAVWTHICGWPGHSSILVRATSDRRYEILWGPHIQSGREPDLTIGMGFSVSSGYRTVLFTKPREKKILMAPARMDDLLLCGEARMYKLQKECTHIHLGMDVEMHHVIHVYSEDKLRQYREQKIREATTQRAEEEARQARERKGKTPTKGNTDKCGRHPRIAVYPNPAPPEPGCTCSWTVGGFAWLFGCDCGAQAAAAYSFAYIGTSDSLH